LIILKTNYTKPVQLDLLIIQRYHEGIKGLKEDNPKGDKNKDDDMYGIALLFVG
jgi:hypothetical protein